MIAELKETRDYLKGKGIYSPRTEAEYILSHLLNCRRIDLYTEDTELSQFQGQNLRELIEQRASGEPLQYILGETEFYGFKFKVTKGIFIPRPETEILVETVLSYINEIRDTRYEIRNILDLCTGCGNIAISLTKMLPYYKLFASDISEKAVVLACENANLNNVSSNIEFRCGDIFTPWKDKGEFFFDIIVCNPPYIKTKELKDLPHDVKNEPVEALDGGEDGLTFYRRVLQESLFYLKEKGYIFFEIGPDIAEGVKYLLDKNFFNIEVVKDYNSVDRVVVAQKR